MPSVFTRNPPRNLKPEASEKVYKGKSFPEIEKDYKEQRVLANAEKRSSGGLWSTTTWLWIIVVPIAVWTLLLALQPSFVKVVNKRSNKLDHSSLIVWTSVITLIVWILLWGSSKCKTC